LRRTLSTLRKSIGGQWLATEGDSVALRPGDGLDLDVGAFRALAVQDATPAMLGEAVALFRGQLLEGFSLRDSPDFDHWYEEQVDTLWRELGAALARLVAELAAEGEYVDALPHARRRFGAGPAPRARAP